MGPSTWWTATLVAAGIVLSACGAGGGPDELGTAGAGHGDHGDHGGMGAVGGPADASEADRTIDVTALDTMAFDPAELEVDAGETITFVVTNVGEAVHEFTLGDPAMQEQHAEEMAGASEMHHNQPNSIVVDPGETGELTWHFREAGTVEYACHQPGHYPAGMHGEIDVS